MQRSEDSKSQAGFTFPELLIVGAIVLVFVGAMLSVVRPVNNQMQRRDAERQLELAQIMQAIAAYKKATGQLPPHLTTEETQINNVESDAATLCNDLVPEYVQDLPYDPTTGVRLNDHYACDADGQIFATGYSMQISGSKVILSAPSAEGKSPIIVERRFPLF